MPKMVVLEYEDAAEASESKKLWLQVRSRRAGVGLEDFGVR